MKTKNTQFSAEFASNSADCVPKLHTELRTDSWPLLADSVRRTQLVALRHNVKLISMIFSFNRTCSSLCSNHRMALMCECAWNVGRLHTSKEKTASLASPSRCAQYWCIDCAKRRNFLWFISCTAIPWRLNLIKIHKFQWIWKWFNRFRHMHDHISAHWDFPILRRRIVIHFFLFLLLVLSIPMPGMAKGLRYSYLWSVWINSHQFVEIGMWAKLKRCEGKRRTVELKRGVCNTM